MIAIIINNKYMDFQLYAVCDLATRNSL